MYTLLHIYFQNIQYYFSELNMVHKVKYANKVGVTTWKLFGQNQIRTAIHKT